MIAEIDDAQRLDHERVVGYIVYQLHKHKYTILDMAVHPDYRRCGVGTLIVQKLKGYLAHHRRRAIVAEVRETNLDALLFFKAQEFRAEHITRDAYDDTDESAIDMRYMVREEATV